MFSSWSWTQWGEGWRSACVGVGGPGCLQSSSSWSVSWSTEVLLHAYFLFHLSKEGLATFVVPLLAKKAETFPFRLLFFSLSVFNMIAMSAVSEGDK